MAEEISERIAKHAAKSDKALLRAAGAVVAEYEQLVDRYIAFFKDAILSTDFSVDTAQRLAIARKISAELENFILQSGEERLFSTFSEQHAEVARLARDYFRVFGADLRVTQAVKLSGTSKAVLRELLAFNFDELGYQVERQLIQPLRRQLISGVLAEQEGVNIRRALIDSVTSLRPEQMEGVIDDIYSQFYRTVQTRQAEDLGGLEVILYSGPMDNRRSPQCVFMTEYDGHGARGIFLKKEFNQRKINQLLAKSAIRAGGKKSKIVELAGDPKIQGGHFNCRHAVNYVSRAMAEEAMGAHFDK